MNRLGKPSSLLYVWCSGLAPYQVSVGSIRDGSGDGRFETSFHPEEAFWRPLTREELCISRINIASYQMSPVGISSCNK